MAIAWGPETTHRNLLSYLQADTQSSLHFGAAYINRAGAGGTEDVSLQWRR